MNEIKDERKIEEGSDVSLLIMLGYKVATCATLGAYGADQHNMYTLGACFMAQLTYYMPA